MPVTVGAGGAFTAWQAMGRLGPGTWDAYLELDLGGPPARFRIEAMAQMIEPPRTWWRGAGPVERQTLRHGGQGAAQHGGPHSRPRRDRLR